MLDNLKSCIKFDNKTIYYDKVKISRTFDVHRKYQCIFI